MLTINAGLLFFCFLLSFPLGSVVDSSAYETMFEDDIDLPTPLPWTVDQNYLADVSFQFVACLLHILV